jgi:transposase
MQSVSNDDGWRIPDELWRELEPLLPRPKSHPLGCHNPHVPDRAAMNAILFVLRTGCKWAIVDTTMICSHSSAHRRFQEWKKAGIFGQFRKRGLLNDEKLLGIDWDRLAGKKRKTPRKQGPNLKPASYATE